VGLKWMASFTRGFYGEGIGRMSRWRRMLSSMAKGAITPEGTARLWAFIRRLANGQPSTRHRGSLMDRYKIIKNAVGPEVLRLVRDSLIIAKDADYHLEGVPFEDKKRFGDSQCPISYVSYSHPVCEALLLTVQPTLERVTGKALSPTYSYFRIYWTGAILEKPHGQGKLSVQRFALRRCRSATVANLHRQPGGHPESRRHGVLRGHGTGTLARALHRQQQIQVFLHFVDKDGVYADRIFDRRPCLGFDRAMAKAKAVARAEAALKLLEQAANRAPKT